MTSSVQVFVSAGSNIFPQQNIQRACQQLREIFGSIAISSVYRTQSVGFEGDDFLNLVLCFTTSLEVSEVKRLLDEVEQQAGRARGNNSFMSRTLDLDLLLYGEHVINEGGVTVPRADILDYAFVLGPMAELAPDLLHPLEGKSIDELWQQSDFSDQLIERLTGIEL